MLPEILQSLTVPAALEAWDADALTGGSVENGETTLWVRPDKVRALCAYLKSGFQFVRLAGLTCVDRYPQEPRFEIVYLLHSLERNERLKLKVALPGEAPQVDSVCPVWEGANWYEREVLDLFGVTFLDHPDPRRIMMPDYWEGHPLRKDFPVHGHKYTYQND